MVLCEWGKGVCGYALKIPLQRNKLRTEKYFWISCPPWYTPERPGCFLLKVLSVPEITTGVLAHPQLGGVPTAQPWS